MNNQNKTVFARIIFGIGSNLGDKENNIQIAIDKLTAYLNLDEIKLSKIFKNPAMLPQNAPENWNKEFYNLAMSARINFKNFNPNKILEIVKKIEKEIGRNSVERWSPREIDIDILAIDDLIYKNENILEIPHRGLFERDFFYKTTQEIEPDLLKKISLKLEKAGQK